MHPNADEHDDTRDQSDEAPEQNAHLDTIDNGCGCVAVWEELSDHRADADGD